MPAVARRLSKDTVNVPSHGTPNSCPPSICCGFASVITTLEGSSDVFVNLISGGEGIVRKGDKHISHPDPACIPHQTPLATYSPTVFANGKNVGRIGDVYDLALPHIIVTGSPNVFANG